MKPLEHNHQRLRLQEFNRLDIERMMRDSITQLNKENTKIMGLIENPNGNIGDHNAEFYLEEVQNNTAQIVRISSLLLHEEQQSSINTGRMMRRVGVDVK